MRIERYERRGRARGKFLGCGCMILLGFSLVMIMMWLYSLGILTPLVLRLTGVESIGTTDDVFVGVPVIPTAVVQSSAPTPRQVTVNLGTLGSETLPTGADAAVVAGGGAVGARMARVSFTEQGLMDLCARRSVICRSGNNLYRNIAVDLRPGGAVVYADVNAGLYWQRVGIVTRLDETNARFYVVGVDINGIVYNPVTLPFDLDDTVADAINHIEREGNNALRELVVYAEGESYTLSSIAVDDSTLTLMLR